MEKHRHFSLLDNEKVVYLFGNETGKIHTSRYSITDNNDSEFLTLTNFRLIYESFTDEKDLTQIIKTNDISSTELSLPKKTFTDLIYGIIFGIASLVWVWFSFAFGFTSILTWLILLGIAGYSGVNLFSYFATHEIPKLIVNTNSNKLIIDLMSKTALKDSEEIINYIYSHSIGLSVPISIDNY